jgi:hypothetical protein
MEAFEPYIILHIYFLNRLIINSAELWGKITTFSPYYNFFFKILFFGFLFSLQKSEFGQKYLNVSVNHV